MGTFSADLFSISQEQPSLDQIEVKQMIKGEILLAKCTINIEKDLIKYSWLALLGSNGPITQLHCGMEVYTVKYFVLYAI